MEDTGERWWKWETWGKDGWTWREIEELGIWGRHRRDGRHGGHVVEMGTCDKDGGHGRWRAEVRETGVGGGGRGRGVDEGDEGDEEEVGQVGKLVCRAAGFTGGVKRREM